MNTTLVAVIIGLIWTIGVICLCAFIRGGAIQEREQRDSAAVKKGIASARSRHGTQS
jgi:hypothetical protein